MANRPTMTRENRAKQFMPFAALKGYEAALREKEKIIVDKIELSEEMKEELDLKIQTIQRNDIVKVVYFCNNEYLELTGMVSRLDINAQIMKVVNTKISFDDIYQLEKEENRLPFSES